MKMTPSPRPLLFAVLAATSLMSTGCTAHEITPTSTAQPAAVPESRNATPVKNTLYVKNENLRPVFFESGKTQLDPKSMEELKVNVDWLKENLPMQIQVAGYSDGRGTPEQNLATGQRRAAALRDFYVAMGIPRSRIATVSLGQEEPVCFEMTDECQAQNRRAETLIENKSLAAR
jgi:peptidoglycan-associated lipoprotein